MKRENIWFTRRWGVKQIVFMYCMSLMYKICMFVIILLHVFYTKSTRYKSDIPYFILFSRALLLVSKLRTYTELTLVWM